MQVTAAMLPSDRIGPGASDAFFEAVYDELKRVAHHHLAATGAHATLCTTEVVHEAFFKLAGGRETGWENRAHFFGAASHAMRQVLVDFARRRRAGKRGGDRRPVTLRDDEASLQLELDEILTLDSALERLGAMDARLQQVVELRFFGGVPEREIAQMLGVSPRTIERDWLKAKLFLLEALEPGAT